MNSANFGGPMVLLVASFNAHVLNFAKFLSLQGVRVAVFADKPKVWRQWGFETVEVADLVKLNPSYMVVWASKAAKKGILGRNGDFSSSPKAIRAYKILRAPAQKFLIVEAGGEADGAVSHIAPSLFKVVFAHEFGEPLHKSITKALFSYWNSTGESLEVGERHERKDNGQDPKTSISQKPMVRKERPRLPAIKIKLPTIRIGIRPQKAKSILLAVVVFFVLAFSLPTLALCVSLINLKLGAGDIKKADSLMAIKRFTTSYHFAKFASEIYEITGLVPLWQEANIVTKIADTGVSGATLLREVEVLSQNILEAKNFDLEKDSRELALGLGELYVSSSFLESDIESSTILRRLMPQQINLVELRLWLLGAETLATKLPELISGDTPKSYMLLLQNNMELRPTGGFIGSFAIVTFSSGKMIDFEVLDVYSADGQLKGYVAPPKPIVDYLGEAVWYLRDSNWDVDFSSSAKTAQWFLEKELDRSVEGVVGIDLYLAQSLLEIAGPVNLPDFGEEINSQNMYEKIQHEVESEFFPGSHKKANILSSLTRSLFDKLSNSKTSGALGKVILDNLQKRHIQIFINNESVQSVINDLGWGGRVETHADLWLGLASANLGVNKVNYYLSENSNLEVVLFSDRAEYRLTHNISNGSTQDTSLGGVYKNYIRALAPIGSEFERVEVLFDDIQSTLSPDIEEKQGWVEAGVLVEVPAGKNKSIVFSWSTPWNVDLAGHGQIDFLWRKQAGTGDVPITVKIISSPQISLYATPASLTGEPGVLYNTNLTKDFNATLRW